VYRVAEYHREIYHAQGHNAPPGDDVLEGGLRYMQLPYIHIKLVEGILVKDVDATIHVYEDLCHPHSLNKCADHQVESSCFNYPIKMIGAIKGDWPLGLA